MSTQDESPAVAPFSLLPSGIVLFTSVPLAALRLEALGPGVGDGLVIVRDAERAAVVLFRDGMILAAFSDEAGVRAQGVSVLRRLAAWNHASVSARRLEPEVMDLVPALLHGVAVYEDLRAPWVDSTALLDDLRARGGAYVVVVEAGAAQAALMLSDGRQVAELSAPAGSGSFGRLCNEPESRIRVLTVPEQEWSAVAEAPQQAAAHPAAPAPATAPGQAATAEMHASGAAQAVTDPQPNGLDSAMLELFGRPQLMTAGGLVGSLAAEAGSREVLGLERQLRGLAQARLHRSADRIERLLDAAITDGRSLQSLAEAVRSTPIRGVTRPSLERLADDMLALAEPLADQRVRPA